MASEETRNTFSGHSNRGFQLASNFGQIHVNIHGQPNQLQPDIAQQQERWLDKLSNATQATFDSYERQHDPICLQNTRVGVLNEIRAWADGEDERRIFWLSGLAGTGKSTVARTIARDYYENGRLGASFFFSKGGGDVGHARKFFTTIALQLAEKSPALRSCICDIISKHKDIANKSLRDQWHHLILQPLSKLDGKSTPSSYILVVDALDECEGESDVCAILQLLAQARSLKTVQLRVFLTSRPEVPIRYGFYQIPDAEQQYFVLHNISPSIIDNDIRIFLEYNFNLIRQVQSLGADWPGNQKVKHLIQKASGLFIWAATACRFVREGKQFALERLDIILKDSITATSAPEQHLDKMYITILRQSIDCNFMDEERESLCSMMRKVLGNIVVLFSPLSVDCLYKLLHVTKEEVDRTLGGLHAILEIPKDQTQPLRLHHPSFRDFLTNKERCRDPNFWIDDKKAHEELADSSIRLLEESLNQNICSLDTYGVLLTDVDSSRVQQCLSPEVQYACFYWIQHLQRSGGRLYDNDKVHQFLQAHVLHWLEAMSWMRKVTEAIQAINALESISLTSDCPGLCMFIHDIKRFALYGRHAIDQAPLQVYCSALIFAPTMSLVRKKFEKRMLYSIKRLPEIEKDWNTVLQTLEGHLDSVSAVAFSPDGKLLASASRDKTVKLWDSGTGAVLQTLEGHLGWVYSLKFSPDGKVLVSASTNRAVKLWDTCTGAALQTLESDVTWINAVAFSPDSKVLALGSGDRTVKLWDAGTGATLSTLEGHSELVNAVAFSPDGKVLASASSDRTVKLWDAGIGAALQTLDSHSDRVNAVAFSPDGKVLVSASNDCTVKLWDAGMGASLQTLESHLDRVNAVAFSPDGKVLASASNDCTVKLWDAGTGAALQTLNSSSDWVNAVSFSPDSKVLALGSSDWTVKLWDANVRAAQQTLEGHLGWVYSVKFSPNGKVLASVNVCTVKLWDTCTGVTLQTLEDRSGFSNTIAFSPDGKVLASVSQCTVKLWDTCTGVTLQTLEDRSGFCNTIAFSPDGKVLASSSDRTVVLWDIGTGAALQTFDVYLIGINTIAFSPDGKVLASAAYGGQVMLWDACTGEALQTLNRNGNLSFFFAIAFSPDGKVLAAASRDTTVKLWHSGTGAVLQTLKVDNYSEPGSTANDGALLETFREMLRTISFSPTEVSRRKLSGTLGGILVNNHWITRGAEKMIWLPSDYRPMCTAVHGNTIALGHTSGLVSILEF